MNLIIFNERKSQKSQLTLNISTQDVAIDRLC